MKDGFDNKVAGDTAGDSCANEGNDLEVSAVVRDKERGFMLSATDEKIAFEFGTENSNDLEGTSCWDNDVIGPDVARRDDSGDKDVDKVKVDEQDGDDGKRMDDSEGVTEFRDSVDNDETKGRDCCGTSTTGESEITDWGREGSECEGGT